MQSQDIWQKIYNSALKFLVPLAPKENYIAVAREAMKLVDGDSASIFVFKENRLKRIYATDKKLRNIKPRKAGVVSEVFNTRTSFIRTKKDLVAANQKFADLYFESNIILPLNYGHVAFGVLSVLSKRKKAFTEKHLNILSYFAPLATMAIRKAQLLEEAEQAVDARNLFISLAEHEIKNPLTSILLNIELLKKNKNIHKLKEFKYIDRLDEITKRLVDIVDEFLKGDERKFTDLHYHFIDQDILALCHSALRELALQNTTHKFILHNLTSKKQIIVHCDENKIVQVLTNLVNNAVKFSAPKTIIETGVKIILRTGYNFVSISVADQGIGIPKEDLPKVFKRYYLGRTRERGMGLGLYLAKEIVIKHKGKINIKSKVGKGTTVTFTLPIVR